MWNKTTQSDQEATGPSSQSQSHPAHNSKQPMQHLNQEKSSGSGVFCNVNMHEKCDYIKFFVIKLKQAAKNAPTLLF